MRNSKVIIGKRFLKKFLVENEDVSKSISRFIDNSIIAYKNNIIEEGICKVKIIIYENLIIIQDNSGGIREEIGADDIFRIGKENGELISGLGIKKSFFKLGNKLDIHSNKKGCSRKFSLDINSNEEELIYQEEMVEYNPRECQGTTIFISDLEKNIKTELMDTKAISKKLGRLFCKFINKGTLEISLNESIVKAEEINERRIGFCDIMGRYAVSIYKSTDKRNGGVDCFINDFMVYEREKSKEVKWNLLNEHKHTYKDCIVEIIYYGSYNTFIDDKEKLFERVIEFIKENRMYFKGESVIIQFEESIEKVEELKDYYTEVTAKAIGKIAFNKLYENYIYSENKK